MDIVLWRHAEAEAGEADLGRRLTSKGEKQARRMAQWLHHRLPDTARIHASPARQAQQTAQALAEATRRRIRTLDALSPSATVSDLLLAIGPLEGKGTLVLVGHQPILGQAVSRLLTGTDREWTIRKGGLVWISHRESVHDDARAALRAAIGPDLT